MAIMLQVPAEQILSQVKFVLDDELDPAEMEPVKDMDTDKVKLVNGQPFYRVPVRAKDRSTKREVEMYVRVLNRPSNVVSESFDLPFTGSAIVSPFVNFRRNNAQAFSVTFDAIAEKSESK